MLTGTIRPVETRTIEVHANTQAEVHALLDAQCPPGFELTDAPVTMKAGTAGVSATGVFKRRDGVREIEADDMTALRAKVPDGYQLITARAI